MRMLRDDAVAMCQGLGFATAYKWNRKRMARKLREIAVMGSESELGVDEGTEDSGRLNELLAGMVKAKGEVELVQEVPKESESEPEPEPEPESEPEPEPEEIPDEEVEDVPEPEEVYEDAEESDRINALYTDDTPAESEVESTDDELEAVEKKPKAKPKKNPKAEKFKEGKTKPKAVKIGKDKFGFRAGTKSSKVCACLSEVPKSMKQLMEEAGVAEHQYIAIRKLVANGLVVKDEDGYRVSSGTQAAEQVDDPAPIETTDPARKKPEPDPASEKLSVTLYFDNSEDRMFFLRLISMIKLVKVG